jgi:hypothetical protein
MNLRAAMAIAGACLAAIFPLAIWVSGWTRANEQGGILIAFRIGVLLLATALAWPQLRTIGRRFPVAVWALLAGLLLLAAARPRWIPVALAIGAGALAVNALLRRLGSPSSPPSSKRNRP